MTFSEKFSKGAALISEACAEAAAARQKASGLSPIEENMCDAQLSRLMRAKAYVAVMATRGTVDRLQDKLEEADAL